MAGPMFIGRLFFNWQESGWCENYPLLGSTLLDAKTNFALIQQPRVAMLANDVNQVGASLHDLSTDRSSYPTGLTYGMGTYATQSSFIDNALVIRSYNAATGAFSPREIRGIPENQFVHTVYNPTVDYAPLVTAFMNAIPVACQILTRSAPPKPYTYTVQPITETDFERQGRRITGRGFFVLRGRAPKAKV